MELIPNHFTTQPVQSDRSTPVKALHPLKKIVEFDLSIAIPDFNPNLKLKAVSVGSSEVSAMFWRILPVVKSYPLKRNPDHPTCPR